MPIGRWVLEEACTRAAAWNVAGHRVGVAVKVSANQLGRDGFATDVRRALQQSGLEPVAARARDRRDDGDATDRAAAAAAARSSSSSASGSRSTTSAAATPTAADLQQMPIDFLKVDRSSLAASEDEDYRSWLLEAILVVRARSVADGRRQGRRDRRADRDAAPMGCTMAQGFFVGQPAGRCRRSAARPRLAPPVPRVSPAFPRRRSPRLRAAGAQVAPAGAGGSPRRAPAPVTAHVGRGARRPHSRPRRRLSALHPPCRRAHRRPQPRSLPSRRPAPPVRRAGPCGLACRPRGRSGCVRAGLVLWRSSVNCDARAPPRCGATAHCGRAERAQRPSSWR